ncbi:hypothetical protein PG993_008898 [Apiospora rasikravindrae]|uniref:Uncharacterized protein n=1 Tax=Apiospora rasikravindrae TaxID=990691 RepID=A0ABR1SPM1_9PEZI
MVANGGRTLEDETPVSFLSAGEIELSDAFSDRLRWCEGGLADGPPAESASDVEDTLDATDSERPGGRAECSRSVEEPLPPDRMTTDGTVTTSLLPAPLSWTRPPTRAGLGV